MQRHIIRNQQMEVLVSSEQDAFVLREQVGKTFQERVVPKLDALFSSLVSPDQHLRFDHLEIDLGEIDPVNEKELFSEKFLAILKEAIEKKLEKAKMTRLEKASSSKHDEDVVWVASKSAHLFQQCRYFLETGLLPWWAGEMSDTFFEKLLDLAKEEPKQFSKQLALLFEEKPQLVKRYRLQFSPTIRQKILALVQPSIYEEITAIFTWMASLIDKEQLNVLLAQWIVRTFGPQPILLEEFITAVIHFQQEQVKKATAKPFSEKTPAFKQLKPALRAQILSIHKKVMEKRHLRQTKPSIRQQFLALAQPNIHEEINAIFIWTASWTKKVQLNVLLRQWTAKPLSPKPILLVEFITAVIHFQQEQVKKANAQPFSENAPAFKRLKPALRAQILSIRKKIKAEKTSKFSTQKKQLDNHTEDQAPKKAKAKKPDQMAKTLKNKRTDSLDERRRSAKIRQAFKEGVQLQNAGLVLLTPFLSQFFKNIGLVENKEFKDEASQERAILLSQYLIKPDTDIPEYDLALNKLLCGLPQETTVAAHFDISNKEKQEVTELLEYAIESWAALKKTSPDLLRTAFLQREGRLVIDDGNWTLQVEQQTHDILLSKIPWGFSLIKLPWMEHFLHVEWGY